MFWLLIANLALADCESNQPHRVVGPSTSSGELLVGAPLLVHQSLGYDASAANPPTQTFTLRDADGLVIPLHDTREPTCHVLGCSWSLTATEALVVGASYTLEASDYPGTTLQAMRAAEGQGPGRTPPTASLSGGRRVVDPSVDPWYASNIVYWTVDNALPSEVIEFEWLSADGEESRTSWTVGTSIALGQYGCTPINDRIGTSQDVQLRARLVSSDGSLGPWSEFKRITQTTIHEVDGVDTDPPLVDDDTDNDNDTDTEARDQPDEATGCNHLPHTPLLASLPALAAVIRRRRRLRH